MREDGRRFVPERIVRAKKRDDGRVELIAPGPGLYRGGPLEGAQVAPGGALGELEVLGVLVRLRAPMDVHGIVVEPPSGRRLARRPVDGRTVLAVLDPAGITAARSIEESTGAAASAGGPVFRTPLGGRYYARPAPGADAFVRPGDEVRAGMTVALIEVMKTFNRVTFGGAGVAERARVRAVVPRDGDDLEPGDVLLELEGDA